MIHFVAAHGENLEMGQDGHLPWPRMSADIKHLHSLINGKTIVMGERTYQEYKDIKHAFNSGKVLVLSRSLKNPPGAEVVALEDIIERGKNEELWVIGGASIFNQLLPYAQTMHLTKIDGKFEADTFFPSYDLNEWQLVQEESHLADERNPFPYTFIELQRTKQPLPK